MIVQYAVEYIVITVIRSIFKGEFKIFQSLFIVLFKHLAYGFVAIDRAYRIDVFFFRIEVVKGLIVIDNGIVVQYKRCPTATAKVIGIAVLRIVHQNIGEGRDGFLVSFLAV